MPSDELIAEGDNVYIGGGHVHWVVVTIESRIDPLGVMLRSPMSGRTCRESLANLRLHSKGGAE